MAMTMRRLYGLPFLLLAIVDGSISLLLFSRLDITYSWNVVIAFSFGRYEFSTCIIDLVFLALFRSYFELGIAAGICWRPTIALERLSAAGRYLTAIVVVCLLFLVAKFLAMTELVHPNEQDMLFWMQFSWSLLGISTMVLVPFAIGKWCSKKIEEVAADDNYSTPAPGVAIEKKIKSSTMLRLLKHSIPDLFIIIPAAIFLVIAAVANVFVPLFIGKAIAAIVVQNAFSDVAHQLLLLSIVALIAAFASGARGSLFTLAGARFQRRVRKDLLSSLLFQDVAFFDENRTGDLMSRLSNDVTTMGDTLTRNVNVFLRNVVQAVGIAIMLSGLSWRLSILTFGSLPLISMTNQYFGNYVEKLFVDIQNALSKASQVAEEAVSNIRTILSMSGSKSEILRYCFRLDKVYRLQRKECILYAGMIWSDQILSYAVMIGTLIYGGHLVSIGNLTGSDFITVLYYQLSLADCLQSIGSVYTGLMQATGASTKVFELLDRIPKRSRWGPLTQVPYHADAVGAHLEFKNVSFSYPTRPDNPVLRHISFVVQPGQFVAIVGHSGSGKSSIIALLERWYEASSGSVLLDGIPVGEYDDAFLHGKGGVALVSQEPILFARSISANISYPALDAEDEIEEPLEAVDEVKAAAKFADADNFVSELPARYGTQCGEKGVQLSAGQKQRIAIARALVRKPRLLILDEATSALDSTAEANVQQHLTTALPGLTILVIAHRLSTVRHAHRILVVHAGEIVQSGTHDQLMANEEGHYALLVKAQLEKQNVPKEALRQSIGAQNNNILLSCSLPPFAR